MNKKITIDQLTEYGVSIKWQNYIVDEGIEYEIDMPHRCAFVNSVRGRADLLNALNDGDIAQADYNAIMAKWGDAPTIEE